MRANQYPWANPNSMVIQEGKMSVSTAPSLGLELEQDYLKAQRAAGEPWWG